MSGSAPTFHAETTMRRESGSVRRVDRMLEIWSIERPSGAGQDRHWTPYTGPSSPSGEAHSSQMVTPLSRSQPTLLSPRRNHSSSNAIDLKCTFFVVTKGKLSDRSYRSRSPKRLTVPVPVRSCFGVPCSRMRRRRSSYWVSIGAATGPSLRAPTDTRPRPGTPAPGVARGPAFRASALGDEGARGDLAAVGEGADPEVVE